MKRNDKNSFVKLVDKLFSKNKTTKFKRKFIIFSVLGLMSSLILSVTLPIVLKSKPIEPQENIYYKFDDQYFSSKEEVYDYSQSKAIKTNYSFDTNKYLFNDKVFNLKSDLDNYVKNKFQVKNITTKRNPNDYLINGAGELSALVKTSEYEKNITVYKGMNDLIHFSKEDALETYLDDYSLNYTVDGQIFDNIFSAREYYLNIKLEDLKENQKKTICFEQGGMCQTKEQITSWLRNNTVKGFEYRGQDFSNLNYSEFVNAMKNLDQSVIDKNIEPVLNADRSSYWVTQNLKNNLAYFVGPKYFESNESVGTVAHFEPVKTYDVNALLTSFMGGVFSNIITSILKSKFLPGESGGTNYDMKEYLKYVFNKAHLNKKPIEDFNRNFYDKLSPNLKTELSYGLSDIKDEELSDFYRLLISSKRFLDLSKIYDIGETSSDKLEQNLKEIVVAILNSEKDFMNKMLDINNDGTGANILLDESISFDDIYSLFLNTSAFFNDGGTKKILWDIAEKILKGIDKIMDIMGEFSDNVGKVKDNIGQLKKEPNKVEEKFTNTANENHRLITETLVNNNEKFMDAMGFKLEDSINKIAPLAILAIMGLVSAAWNLGKMFSFITLKTYEAKLDNNQSLFYFEPTFKIPLTNISFGGTVQDQTVHVLNQSPLNYFSPSKDGEALKELYEFNGKYYKEKQNAIEDLKYEIYKKPEKYLKTKKLFTSVISKDNNYMLSLPKICDSKNSNEDCLSNYEYERRLAQEKENFIQSLFTKFYVETGKEYFLDGFGGAHETLQLAMNELRKKADNFSNYKEVYSYSLYNTKVVKDSKSEIQEFIRNNKIIESKSIINTDLIATNYFDNLKENNNYDFTIFEMIFYGQRKYFRSYLEAIRYLDRKINYEVYSYNREEKTYEYKGVKFLSGDQFIEWVENQIQIVSEQEYLNKGGALDYAENNFNSLRY